MRHRLVIAWMPLALCACTSQWDMQGEDPKDHYKEHPIENRVESKSESYTLYFAPGRDRLTHDEADSLRAALAAIPPMAVESVQIQLPSADMRNEARKEHLSKLLRQMGYKRRIIMYEPSEALQRHSVRIDIDYASVVTPRCPDWRASPVTTYSNTSQAGFGCASVNNLGQMVANPRDLERGHGMSQPDAERNSAVLKQYRTNESAGDDADAPTNATVSTAP